jgi:hypothetical protein
MWQDIHKIKQQDAHYMTVDIVWNKTASIEDTFQMKNTSCKTTSMRDCIPDTPISDKSTKAINNPHPSTREDRPELP